MQLLNLHNKEPCSLNEIDINKWKTTKETIFAPFFEVIWQKPPETPVHTCEVVTIRSDPNTEFLHITSKLQPTRTSHVALQM